MEVVQQSVCCHHRAGELHAACTSLSASSPFRKVLNMSTRACLYMCACMYICVYVCMCACMCARVCVCVLISIYSYTCTCACTRIHGGYAPGITRPPLAQLPSCTRASLPALGGALYDLRSSSAARLLCDTILHGRPWRFARSGAPRARSCRMSGSR